MKMTLPCCFIPSRVVIAGNNQGHLDRLERAFGKNQGLLTFSDIDEALQYINQGYQSDAYLNRCICIKEGEKPKDTRIVVRLREINKEIYNENRFDEVSVFVFSSASPDVNELEICSAVTAPYVKRLLLADNAGIDSAVQGFNDGIIDKFLLKGSKAVEKLDAEVFELQQRYYEFFSNKVTNLYPDDMLFSLKDRVFIDYFFKLVKERKIVEYYIADMFGSYLLLDADANPTWLAVCPEDDVLGYFHLANEADTPQDILGALFNKEKIPFFFSDEQFNTPQAEWGPYLHPATKIEGELNTYYVSIIEPSEQYSLDRTKIMSYNEHLAKN